MLPPPPTLWYIGLTTTQWSNLPGNPYKHIKRSKQKNEMKRTEWEKIGWHFSLGEHDILFMLQKNISIRNKRQTCERSSPLMVVGTYSHTAHYVKCFFLPFFLFHHRTKPGVTWAPSRKHTHKPIHRASEKPKFCLMFSNYNHLNNLHCRVVMGLKGISTYTIVRTNRHEKHVKQPTKKCET
jgi:hypothetical protein